MKDDKEAKLLIKKALGRNKVDLTANKEIRVKRPYHKSSKQLARAEIQKQIKQRKTTINKRTITLDKAKGSLKDKQKSLNIISDTLVGKRAIEEKEILKGPALVRRHFNNQPVAFRPNPGPQTEFLASEEDEVLYGGAAGGGKSYGLLAEALRYVHRPACRVLILRRTLDELDELIWKSREFYKAAFPEANYNKSDKRWLFPSGAEILFSYLDKDEDVNRYQGHSFSLVCFDELTHWPSPYPWTYLRSRVRSTDPEIKCYMRATTNPGGVGGHWVRKMFVDPAPVNTAFWGKDLDTGRILRYPFDHYEKANEYLLIRKFIPARLKDNPYLWQDGKYEANLLSLPEVERKRLLEGDWDVVEGAAFPEFEKRYHVVNAFDIFKDGLVPNGMLRIRGCDYGYRSPACVLWGGVHPDGTLIIYRELYQSGLTPEALALKILELEQHDPHIAESIIDESAFARDAGQISIAEQINRYGLRFMPSNRDRIIGKNQIHQRLRFNPETKKPRMIIFDNCENLVREISTIPVAKNNAEDVDTHASDHAYDTLRYMCMLRRVESPNPYQRLMDIKMQTPFQPMDQEFGY